jgi:hypothetical protein
MGDDIAADLLHYARYVPAGVSGSLCRITSLREVILPAIFHLREQSDESYLVRAEVEG